MVLVVGLVAASCTGGGSDAAGPSGSGAVGGPVVGVDVDLLSREADPLDVTLELEAESVTEVVGPEGGVVEMMNAEGLTLRLTVPEGAVVFPTEITMTPLTEMVGTGLEPGIGVQLEPHGLSLLRPATLTLELPPGRTVGDLWGVSTLAGGEQVALHPVLPADPGFVELPLFGFSSYGAFPGGRANAEDIADRPVTSAGRRMAGAIARLMQEVFQESNESGRDLSERIPWDRILAMREYWITNGIMPLREEALTDDIAFLRFEYEMMLLIGWDAVFNVLGIPVGNLLDEVAELMAWPTENARDRAVERCKTEHRLDEFVYAVELATRLTLLGYGGSWDFAEAFAKCFRFRLTFESTITQEGAADGVENRAVSFVAGEVEELYHLEGIVLFLAGTDYYPLDGPIGIGTLEYLVAEGTSTAELPGGRCEATVVGGEGSEMRAVLVEVALRPRKYGPWSVPEIYGPVDPPPDPPEPAVVTVALDPGDPIEKATGSCPGFSESSEHAIWDTVFAVRHGMDLILGEVWAAYFQGEPNPAAFSPPEQTGFFLDLDEFEGGRVYATGRWEGCQGGAGARGDGGVFGETCERTLITLYHEPLP